MAAKFANCEPVLGAGTPCHTILQTQDDSEIHLTKLPAHTLLTALRGYYAPSAAGVMTIDRETLISLLQTLPSLSATAHNDSIVAQLQLHHPGIGLAVEDQSVIMFVDDFLSKILKQIDMEFRVEAMVRNIAPLVAIEALAGDVPALLQPLQIYELLDALIRECVGWSEDLGFLGEKYIEKTEAALLPLCRGKLTPSECLKQFKEDLRSERHRQKKLELNLIGSEQQKLVEDSAKQATAEMLNQKMAAQPLPLFIIFMMQGAWYEFAQKTVSRYGLESQQWAKMSELTELLVWSLQPQAQAARQQQLFHSIPIDITAFADSVDFDATDVKQCLADVEAEYEAINDDNPSSPCDFDPISSRASSGIDGNIEVALRADIEATQTGAWYLYDDKNEADEKIARIRLIINDPTSGRLVFTNQNRRKVMHMTYMEFAARISSGTVKSLDLSSPLKDIVSDHLDLIIKTIKAQKGRELKEQQIEQRKQISKEFLSKQKTFISNEMQRLKQRAALKKKRAKLLREKVAKKIDSANQAVEKLRPDAWVKLPLMEGTQTPCKLVAVVTAADKFIFANRAGIKVAEYTASQLSHMIVTENSEILDTGAEFENVLATVVSGLRENRNKSFDQLTSTSHALHGGA
ncbi:MAG: hypothetical protein ACJAYE_000098 [Candidatus Azotimanducaceae bacterium]|jgi:hypothetical protein